MAKIKIIAFDADDTLWVRAENGKPWSIPEMPMSWFLDRFYRNYYPSLPSLAPPGGLYF